MAQILIPNITEAAMLSGKPYRETLSEDYVADILESLTSPCVILTGVGYKPGETGIAIREGKQVYRYSHPRLGTSYHGTGDIFAAAFTGALMQTGDFREAAQTAADFTCRCIENTQKNPAHWYGVKFEQALVQLIEAINK